MYKKIGLKHHGIKKIELKYRVLRTGGLPRAVFFICVNNPGCYWKH